ncbi:MAG: tRNA-dihydrouridine synthase [Gimesia sp.]
MSPINWTSTESPEIAIGNRVLSTRYFLSPLAGYTQFAFRVALRELGGLGLCTTDLVLASQMMAGSRKSKALLLTSPKDDPLTVQIFSGITSELVRGARWLEDRGYEAVDLNMGCPMAKINGNGGGARIMCAPDAACQMVADVVDAVSIPVTVKMRLGWDRDSITAPLLAREFEKAGVAAITIHGRTRSQGFGGSVDLQGIRQTVEAVQQIPVIGNGDVCTVEQAFHMRKETGCEAVSIGRGAMLDPWIFRKISQAIQGIEPVSEPTREEQIQFLIRHFTLMIEQYQEYGCLLIRKFAAWYGVKLGIPDDLEDRLRKIESIDEFHEIVAQIRIRHGERISSVPTALIKTPNGPVERW